MVRQMVGDEVPCAWSGGNPAGGLGTDAAQIRAAIEQVWSDGRRRRAGRSRRGRDERRDGDRDAGRATAAHGCASATRRWSRVPWSRPPRPRAAPSLDAVCAAAEELWPVSAVRTEVLITHPTGLHARPAVKLTKLAKTFAAAIRLRRRARGDWVDAKSIVKVMGAEVAHRHHARAGGRGRGRRGRDGRAARRWSSGISTRMAEQRLRGRAGLAGPGHRAAAAAGRLGGATDATRGGQPRRARAPAAARRAHGRRARGELSELAADADAMGAEILEFQIELLDDPALVEEALRRHRGRRTRGERLARRARRQIAAYEEAEDEYFRARAADLARPARPRARRASAAPRAGTLDLPAGAILLARDLDAVALPGAGLAQAGRGRASRRAARAATSRCWPAPAACRW